jgi:thymidylate kinase
MNPIHPKPDPFLPGHEPVARPLGICHRLFAALENQAVGYCHWKSNANLDRGLAGQTDLDLLIDRTDEKKFLQIIKGMNFKRVVSPPGNRFSGMVDYLGFDHKSGCLCHLHVHYRLVLGQKYIKNHHLPIERLVLSNLRTHCGVNIPRAEVELLLLVIRSVLKFDVADYHLSRLKNVTRLFPEGIEKDFAFLKRDCTRERFHQIVAESGLPLLPERLFVLFEKISQHTVTLADLAGTRSYLFKALRPFRRHTGFRLALHHIRAVGRRPIFYKAGLLQPKKKVLPGKGSLFALVGADGAGKSTLTGDLERWLSWKLNVSSVYFGIPKLKYRFYNFIYRWLKKLAGLPGLRHLAPIATKAGCMRWLRIARHRVHVHSKSMNKIGRGEIVFTDRYPLTAFWSMAEPMDGPRIRGEFEGMERLARLEEGLYTQIGYPDRLFVLNVDPDRLACRKTGTASGRLKAKAAAIAGLAEDRRTSLIDANKEYPAVLLAIKTKIWEALP